VSTSKRHNLLIIEPHPLREHFAKVVCRESAVGKSTARSAPGVVDEVSTARRPGRFRPSHRLREGEEELVNLNASCLGSPRKGSGIGRRKKGEKTHLHRRHACQSPKIRVRDPGVLVLDRLKEETSVFEPSAARTSRSEEETRKKPVIERTWKGLLLHIRTAFQLRSTHRCWSRGRRFRKRAKRD
jgi:hypothetical protein